MTNLLNKEDGFTDGIKNPLTNGKNSKLEVNKHI
jgi:hypothetical protein